MKAHHTTLDLIRFVAGITKAVENILGTISVPVPGGAGVTLSLMEWHVLERLARHASQAKKEKGVPTGLSQSVLVSAAETPRSSALSTSLTNLEYGKKFIKRESAPPAKFRRNTENKEDGRNRLVSLTKVGQAVHDQAKQRLETQLAENVIGFSTEEIERLADQMEMLRNNIVTSTKTTEQTFKNNKKRAKKPVLAV
jgi:predicted house-cleaning noncanonical NTP pyrophosphatase (MazG superfamily)